MRKFICTMLVIGMLMLVGCSSGSDVMDYINKAEHRADGAIYTLEQLDESLAEKGVLDEHPKISGSIDDIRAQVIDVKMYLEIIRQEILSEK